MDHIEASVLLGTIEGQSCLKPKMHQLGNGEWVIIANNVWLWGIDDWEKCKHNWGKSLYTLETLIK